MGNTSYTPTEIARWQVGQYAPSLYGRGGPDTALVVRVSKEQEALAGSIASVHPLDRNPHRMVCSIPTGGDLQRPPPCLLLPCNAGIAWNVWVTQEQAGLPSELFVIPSCCFATQPLHAESVPSRLEYAESPHRRLREVINHHRRGGPANGMGHRVAGSGGFADGPDAGCRDKGNGPKWFGTSEPYS